MLAKHNRSGTCMYGWCSRRIISMLDSDRTCLRNTDYGHCAVLGNVLIMQYLFTFRALWVLGGGGEGFLHISWTSTSRTLLLWPLCALRRPPLPHPQGVATQFEGPHPLIHFVLILAWTPPLPPTSCSIKRSNTSWFILQTPKLPFSLWVNKICPQGIVPFLLRWTHG